MLLSLACGEDRIVPGRASFRRAVSLFFGKRSAVRGALYSGADNLAAERCTASDKISSQAMNETALEIKVNSATTNVAQNTA